MASLIKDTHTMKILLEESNLAFTITMETGGAHNTDFADYTSNNFIKGFRHVLQKPDLSRAQLASMLRQAEQRRQKNNVNSEKWADMMAKTIAKGANSNIEAVN